MTPPNATAGRVLIEELTWRPFGRREPVLRSVSLEIPAGERVLLVGPSGSGKSTLLRAMTGLLGTVTPGELSGSVTIDGNAPDARAGTVGLVLQEPGVGVVAATVERDVAFGLENIGMPRGQMPDEVAAALSAVGLELPASTSTTALSGGQTQRLALAGALALAPRLLLLDEPTAMLDAESAEEVRSAVSRVTADRSVTLVVVEHVLGPWVPMVDRLVVLSAAGEIVADGPPAAVLADRGAELAAQGIWVPGVPDPSPLDIPAEAFPPSPVGLLPRATPLRVERVGRGSRGEVTRQLALELDRPLTPAARSSTAIVGPSGCGKSTLLQVLAGFLTPSSGSATLGAQPVADVPSRERAAALAWVPQWAGSTFAARTVRDEVLTTARALGRGEAGLAARADALLAALGLDRLAEADPRQLSGGEQRRLAVAAAVLHQPALLLADEPTVGQDRHTWAAVVGVIRAYRRGGGSVVVSTHDRAVIARADEVVALTAPMRTAPQPPRLPLVGRCGPLALFAGSAWGILAGVSSPGWRVSAVVWAVQLVLGAIGLIGMPWWPAVRRWGLRMLPGLLAGLSVGWSTWLLAGRDVEVAATAYLRVLLIVTPSAFLLPWVDPDRLGDHLAQQLRLPARPVVAMSSALQRVQTFAQTWTEIDRARTIRGLGPRRWSLPSLVRHLSALTFGVFVRSLAAAAELAIAMDARGFARAQRRTWFAAAPWRWRDSLLVIVAAVPAVLAVVAGRAGG